MFLVEGCQRNLWSQTKSLQPDVVPFAGATPLLTKNTVSRFSVGHFCISIKDQCSPSRWNSSLSQKLCLSLPMATAEKWVFFFFFSVFGNKYLQKKTMGPLPLGERGWRILTLGWCLKFQEIKPFFFFFSSRFLKNRQMMGSSGDGSETFPSCFFFPGPSKCEVERYAAVRYQHAYVPSCDPDGGYTPVQCQQGGQCWCVDTKGREVQGTKRRGQPPACGMC